jgi:putative MATE family efflux protein
MASRPGQDLTKGPIGPTLLKFAMPTLVSSILQSLNGSINAIWIGRFLGEEALASTFNANFLLFVMMAFVFGFGMASTVLIGQAFGAKDIVEARRVVGTAIGSFVPVAAVVGIAGWFASPAILAVLGVPPEATPLALDYLRVLFTAMPAILMLVMLMMALRGSGDAMTPLWFMILAVVLDAGLNPLLILGVGPLPRLGIAGSALATTIANYVALAAMLAAIYWRDLPLRLRGRELAFLLPDRRLLGVILRKGLPMGLQMIVISTSALATIGLVNREGAAVTAAFGVAMQLWTYLQMPGMSLAAAAGAMAAQSIGAGLKDRVDHIAWIGILQNLAITGILVVVLVIADRPMLALFLGGDSEALPIARHIQLLGTWSFLMFGVTMIIFGVVRANGAVIGPLIILAVGLYPARLGFALAAYPWLGADALWLSFPFSSLINMGLAIAYYRHGGWRKARMGPPPIADECIEEAEATTEPGGRISPAG